MSRLSCQPIHGQQRTNHILGCNYSRPILAYSHPAHMRAHYIIYIFNIHAHGQEIVIWSTGCPFPIIPCSCLFFLTINIINLCAHFCHNRLVVCCGLVINVRFAIAIAVSWLMPVNYEDKCIRIDLCATGCHTSWSNVHVRMPSLRCCPSSTNRGTCQPFVTDLSWNFKRKICLNVLYHKG